MRRNCSLAVHSVALNPPVVKSVNPENLLQAFEHHRKDLATAFIYCSPLLPSQVKPCLSPRCWRRRRWWQRRETGAPLCLPQTRQTGSSLQGPCSCFMLCSCCLLVEGISRFTGLQHLHGNGSHGRGEVAAQGVKMKSNTAKMI